MGLKYEKLDSELFSWLDKKRHGVTTAQAIQALKVTDRTTQRHISRRFSQLEDRGNLVCSLEGTMRVCEVVGDLPKTLAKKGQQKRLPLPEPANQGIYAENSEEFLAAGGKIEYLPAEWDDPEKVRAKGSLPMGPAANGGMVEHINIDD